MKILTFNPGDLLFRSKGLYKHVGVYIGWGRVLQNTPERGEHVADLHEFSEDQKVEVKKSSANVVEVLTRAEKKIRNPRPYDLLTNNCEHTAYEIAAGNRTSPQLWFWGAMLSLFIIFLLLRNIR